MAGKEDASVVDSDAAIPSGTDKPAAGDVNIGLSEAEVGDITAEELDKFMAEDAPLPEGMNFEEYPGAGAEKTAEAEAGKEEEPAGGEEEGEPMAGEEDPEGEEEAGEIEGEEGEPQYSDEYDEERDAEIPEEWRDRCPGFRGSSCRDSGGARFNARRLRFISR